MPQLPSGRQLFADGGTWDDLKHVHTLEDLAPHIAIELFREVTPFDQHRITTQPPLVPQSLALPDDMVLCDSGYTLADFDGLIADWSDEDVAALHKFIDSPRFQTYLRNKLRHIHVATGQAETTLADVVMFHPPTRELFERNND